REAHSHMAVVEDGVVLAVGLLDLVQRLRDQEALQTVTGHESERALEEVETAERRKLVEHQQQPMPAALRVQFLREAAADLIEDQAHKRLGPADVRWRDDEIERHGTLGLDQITDAPVAAPGDRRDNRISIEAEEGHGGRQDAGAFILALVQELARGARDDG